MTVDKEELVVDVVVEGHLEHSSVITFDCFQSQIRRKSGSAELQP